MNTYKYSANLYDEGTDLKIGKDDIKFYLQEISKTENILEIGCGTGRVAIELAKRGNIITGLDLSEKMLQVFQEKIISKTYKNKISIVQSDMTSFNIDEKFDWIIFPFRSFQALTTDKQRKDCLICVKNHLKRNGKIIIQIFNPITEVFEKWSSTRNLDFKFWSNTINKKVERHMIGEIHSKEDQTIKFHYLFKIFDENNKIIREFKDPMKLGYLFNQQAVEIFGEIGLKVKELYSDWNKKPVKVGEKKELIYKLTI